MGRKKSVDPRVYTVIEELKVQAEKHLRDVSSRYSNKAEAERARISYEVYSDAIKRVINVFELDTDVLRKLNKEEHEAVSGLQFQGVYGGGPYFNDHGSGDGQRPRGAYVYTFSFFVGRHQHLAHYKWTGARWSHGTITKMSSSGRETMGTTISKYDREKYWRFLDGQVAVQDKLHQSVLFLEKVERAVGLLKEHGVAIIKDVEMKEKVWIGSAYGYGVSFKVAGAEDCLFTALVADDFGGYEQLKAEIDGLRVDAAPLFTSFTKDLMPQLQKAVRS